MNRINVLSYLDDIYKKLPDKTAFSCEDESLTFLQLYNNVNSIGSFLQKKGCYSKPVVVFMKKSPAMIAAFFGVIAAGCYYVPIDDEMPRHRIQLIFDTLKPETIICDNSTRNSAEKLKEETDGCFDIEEYTAISDYPHNLSALLRIREKAIDTDPIYIVFTSGSTGVPKGVAACHRSVIDYVENLTDVLNVTEDFIFGNQAPLYVDACLKEIYSTLKYGATTYLIPKQLFMFPVKLVEYLNEHKINAICWVVPALTMISGFNTFKSVIPQSLHTIAFGSEVFPIKQFNTWRKTLPDCRFINLYGPTEATGMSCYYEATREFQEDESIPIGKPFKNTQILLLTDDNKEAAPGEPGEICIRGTAVTLGYYNDFERTSTSFVQNPLNNLYPEIIYRTGDLGKYNPEGDLMFISRKDYQIKHMGHRIELGEIEMIANKHESVECSCCIFDKEKSKIILYYIGAGEEKELSSYLKYSLPRYMIPSKIIKLETLPLTPNGKIDRLALKKMYSQEK